MITFWILASALLVASGAYLLGTGGQGRVGFIVYALSGASDAKHPD